MFDRKYKAKYRITAEMLSLLLFKERINIETMIFDKDTEILEVYVSGDKLKELGLKCQMAEGDAHPALKHFMNQDGSMQLS